MISEQQRFNYRSLKYLGETLLKIAPEKLLVVESVRGLACFVVLLSHLSLTFFPYLHNAAGPDSLNYPIQHWIYHSPLAFFYSGSAAVSVFFALSGYILAMVVFRSATPKKRVLGMAFRRYPRLMLPALASCCLAYLVLTGIEVDKSALTAWIQQYGDFQPTLKGAIYSGAIRSFFAYGYSPYNPVLWTMFIELLGSVVVYALCWNKLVVKIPFLALIVALVTVVLTVTETVHLVVGLGMLAFLGGYGFSQLGAYLKPYMQSHMPWLFLVMGLYLAGAHSGSAAYGWITLLLGVYTDLLCHCLAALLLVYAVIFNPRLHALMAAHLPVWMGKMSFSVYLLHLLVINTLGVVVFNTIYALAAVYVVAALAACVGVIIGAYLLGWVFYYGVDAPAMRLSRALSEIGLRGYAVLTNIRWR